MTTATIITAKSAVVVIGHEIDEDVFTVPERGRRASTAAHEIVHLPSVSALAVLRHEGRERRVPAGTIAVLADPVFSAADPRVASCISFITSNASMVKAPVTTGFSQKRRLRNRRYESEAFSGTSSGMSAVLCAAMCGRPVSSSRIAESLCRATSISRRP